MTPHHLTGLAAVLLLACGRSAEEEPAPATKTDEVMLTAAQIQRGGIRWLAAGEASAGAMAAAVALPGQLVPDEDRTARLGAPAPGRVLVVQVSPGQRVEAGRILATLQSPDAGMAQADLAKASAAVASRRANTAYATSAKERAERLLALKAIPRQDYEKAVADDELSRSELAGAEAELARARSTARALGAEGRPSGELAIRAPRAGVVLERLAAPGTVVEAGAPLLVVTDPRSLWLTLAAPESEAGSLRLGAPVRFVVPAFPTETLSAKITAVGAGLDSATRTLAARAAVANPAGRLKSAMLATVLLPGAAHRDTTVLVLPDSAVQVVDGAPVVFVAMPMDSGRVHLMLRRVKTGARSGGRIEILDGIAAGDLVVTAGAFAVKAELKKSSSMKMEM